MPIDPLRALHRPRLWPLRTQVRVLVCTLILLTAAVVGELWAGRTLAQAQADTGQHLLQIARNMADRLSQDMATRTRDVLLLSQLEVLRGSDDPAAARDALERLRNTLPAYAWIGLTDAEGTVVAATGDALVGRSIAARPVFQQGRQGLWVGDVHDAVLLAKLAPPQANGESVKFVDVAAPIHHADGRLRGVIALHLSWEWASQLRDALQPRGRPGIEVMVFGAQGDLLLAPPGKAPWPHLGRERLKALDEQWALERWSDGSSTLSAAAQSAGSGGFKGFGWRVVARDRQPEGPVTVADARLDVLPWAATIGLVCAGVAWLVIGLIVAPVDELAQALRTQSAAPVRREGVRPRRRNDVQQIAAAVADLQNTLRDRDETVQALERQAHVDPLTGLWSRSYLQALSARLSEAPAGSEMEFCVLCLDLDGFKAVNDRFGHEAGDEVLVQVAKRLRQIAREEDFIVRLGGDEFMLMLPCPAGEAAHLSRQAAMRVLSDLQRPMHYLTLSNLRVGGSVGASVWPHDGSTLSEVMARAEEALAAARRAGPGQYRQFAHAAPMAAPAA